MQPFHNWHPPCLATPNPRWGKTDPSITLPKVLKGIAIVVAAGAGVAAVVALLGVRSEASYDEWDAALVWSAAQLFAGGLAGGLLWYVVARVVERLDQIAEALERTAEE